MEFNRNQYFAAGMVLLLLGIQFRLVESYVLNDRASEFLSAYVWEDEPAAEPPMLFVNGPLNEAKQETVEPPSWVGWVLIALGAVLVLHSLAMRKPGQ